jgi:hypothetical protein
LRLQARTRAEGNIAMTRSTTRSVILSLALLALLAAAARAAPAARVDGSTLNGKLIMGYQAWFGCPDPASKRGWVHWKSGDALTVDMVPDVSELSPAERCDSGLRSPQGQPIYFYDGANAQTIDRHFAWMEQYGIHGVALQKFVSQFLRPETQARSDVVLHHVREAAERHGRIFYLMYDLSGATDDRLAGIVEDWERLLRSGEIAGPSYLKHRGGLVLGLWGIGFAGRSLTPAGIETFFARLREVSASFGGVALLGGVPAYWRLGQRDASDDPAWKTVWPKLDIISPWTVGRYADERGAEFYRDQTLVPDLAAARAFGADYMPVIFPGFSRANLMQTRHQDKAAIANQIPRRCGRFYWEQARNALGAGAAMIYNAMFDEVDEGTAMFKLTPSADTAPAQPHFVTLDADGCRLPSDWYLRLAGQVSAAIAAQQSITADLPPAR